jgi:hypothetical protein
MPVQKAWILSDKVPNRTKPVSVLSLAGKSAHDSCLEMIKEKTYFWLFTPIFTLAQFQHPPPSLTTTSLGQNKITYPKQAIVSSGSGPIYSHEVHD